MSDAVINTSLLVMSPIAGSVLWHMSYDLYHVYITKKQRWCRPFSYEILINPGLVLGGLIGYARYCFKMPILDYVLRNY